MRLVDEERGREQKKVKKNEGERKSEFTAGLLERPQQCFFFFFYLRWFSPFSVVFEGSDASLS